MRPLPTFFYTVALKKRENAVSNRPPQQLKNWEGGLNTGNASPGQIFQVFESKQGETSSNWKKTKNLKTFVKGAESGIYILKMFIYSK